MMEETIEGKVIKRIGYIADCLWSAIEFEDGELIFWYQNLYTSEVEEVFPYDARDKEVTWIDLEEFDEYVLDQSRSKWVDSDLIEGRALKRLGGYKVDDYLNTAVVEFDNGAMIGWYTLYYGIEPSTGYESYNMEFIDWADLRELSKYTFRIDTSEVRSKASADSESNEKQQ